MTIAGPVDNRELESRPDVLTFTTTPLPGDVELSGHVEVELCLTSDVEHFDVFARLCDVAGDGTTTNVCDAIVRVDPATDHPGRGAPVRLRLSATAAVFAAGHRIRLQVSGGSFPIYARHTCTSEPLATMEEVVIAHHLLHHDPARPSSIVLPVVSGMAG
jgi:putative CocE/NonD family hydrolase